MAKLYDKDGKEVEAFTREEIDLTIQTEKESAIAEANALREEEIAGLLAEKEKLEDDRVKLEQTLEGMKNKDVNFGKIRSQVEIKDKKIEELQAQLTAVNEGTTKRIEEIEGSRIKEVKDGEISSIAGADVELTKKINFFYDSFAGSVKTKEEIKARVTNATLLATGGKTKVNMTGDVISSGGSMNIPTDIQGQGKLSSPEVRDVARKLGITDQELSKGGLI